VVVSDAALVTAWHLQRFLGQRLSALVLASARLHNLALPKSHFQKK
jgi:hypothetical protein